MTAALDAITRLDDGRALPGDRDLADIFDQHCEWEHLRLDDARRERELDAWLADQCPACEEGGRGPICAGCRIDGGVPA